MQVSGVEKAKGKHSKLNLYLKQWVLSLLLCLLESSNLKEQVKKHLNYFMFASLVYSACCRDVTLFCSCKPQNKPLFSCFLYKK
jgi:hypothetical protein